LAMRRNTDAEVVSAHRAWGADPSPGTRSRLVAARERMGLSADVAESPAAAQAVIDAWPKMRRGGLKSRARITYVEADEIISAYYEAAGWTLIPGWVAHHETDREANDRLIEEGWTVDVGQSFGNGEHYIRLLAPPGYPLNERLEEVERGTDERWTGAFPHGGDYLSPDFRRAVYVPHGLTGGSVSIYRWWRRVAGWVVEDDQNKKVYARYLLDRAFRTLDPLAPNPRRNPDPSLRRLERTAATGGLRERMSYLRALIRHESPRWPMGRAEVADALIRDEGGPRTALASALGDDLAAVVRPDVFRVLLEDPPCANDFDDTLWTTTWLGTLPSKSRDLLGIRRGVATILCAALLSRFLLRDRNGFDRRSHVEDVMALDDVARFLAEFGSALVGAGSGSLDRGGFADLVGRARELGRAHEFSVEAARIRLRHESTDDDAYGMLDLEAVASIIEAAVRVGDTDARGGRNLVDRASHIFFDTVLEWHSTNWIGLNQEERGAFCSRLTDAMIRIVLLSPLGIES